MKAEGCFPGTAVILVFWAAISAHVPAQTPMPAGAPAAAVQTAAPTSPQRLKLDGLPNFARISRQLLRGGQPDLAGFAELKKMGVQIVVNLGHEPDEIARERAMVQSQGMEYVGIPWRGSNMPHTAQVVEFLALLRAHPDKQIFVHCQRGAERTGVMVACYRMSVANWTAAQALNEMEQFGFRGLWFRHLKKFVREFPSLLLSDPALARMRNGS